MKKLTVKQRINNGIEYLNKNYPDWLDCIDLDIFDISVGGKCIIGQIYNKKIRNRGSLAYCEWVSDYTHRFSLEHGFTEDCYDKHIYLLREWKKRIIELRSEKPKQNMQFSKEELQVIRKALSKVGSDTALQLKICNMILEIS